MAIKQTIYRTGEDSELMKILLAASRRQEVTVVVELMARFDEQTNINWASKLEEVARTWSTAWWRTRRTHEGMVELIRAERARPGRQARAHHGQDELAAGRADHRRAVQARPASRST